MWTRLKDSLPSGLYSRAALILVAPVIVLQLAVTIAFLQRHFEDVTEQLTQGVALEAAILRRAIETGTPLDRAVLARDLAVFLRPAPEAALESQRLFYDISGIVVVNTLQRDLPGFRGVDLVSDPGRAEIFIDTDLGPYGLDFDRDRVSTANPHQLVIITLFVGALMTFVSYVFLRNQLRPIKRLSAAADAFGKGRALPYKPAGAVEVRAAGQAFLDMRNRIERQIEQRTQMLSGVSHDLRTPLTRMKLELSLLDPGPEVDALERDLAEMEVLLEAFLSFAKTASVEAMAEADPLALLRDCVEKAKRGGIAVGLAEHIPQAAPLVQMRPLGVARALDNLIGNAGRYAGRALVSLRIDPDAVVFTVEDDGPGIPAAQRDEAMRPFARLDSARNQNKGSSVGLGLAIVTDVARSHGGALVLGDSAALGGLKADLVLPR